MCERCIGIFANKKEEKLTADPSKTTMIRRFLHLSCFLISISFTWKVKAVSSSIPSANAIVKNGKNEGSDHGLRTVVLRFRTPKTGTIVSLQINEGNRRTVPLQTLMDGILAQNGDDSSANFECIGPSNNKLDASQTFAQLGLKHGALLTITPKMDTNKKDKPQQKQLRNIIPPFDPFPEFAKPRYKDKRRSIRAKANRRGGMSYSDLDQLADNIHKLQIQTNPIISRIYMCSNSAEAFVRSCKNQQPKCALLFGTVSKERLNDTPAAADITHRKNKGGKMCEVAKVHALWEPQRKIQKDSNNSFHYDATDLTSLTSSVQQAIQLAKRLKLQPVGWIYTYHNNSTTSAEVPVLARDAVIAAKIQIALMKKGSEEGGEVDEAVSLGSRFVTLALNSASGATEAFQMSDQSVQMVAEDIFDEEATNDSTQFLKASVPVIVDGKETNSVDCLLCLVNTGMLSHIGSFSSPSSSGKLSSSGGLTSKIKQKILSHLMKKGNAKETTIIQYLSDFNILFGLSNLLNEADINELCDIILSSKRRRSANVEMSKHLQLTLEGIASV